MTTLPFAIGLIKIWPCRFNALKPETLWNKFALKLISTIETCNKDENLKRLFIVKIILHYLYITLSIYSTTVFIINNSGQKNKQSTTDFLVVVTMVFKTTYSSNFD